MTVKSTAARLEKMLATDEFLQSICDYSPKVYELPFQRSESDKFLIVWPHMREDAISSHNVIYAAQRVVRIAEAASLLKGYKGIEVVPFAGRNVGGDGRIVRVSVYERAFTAALLLVEKDFIGVEVPGYSGWYTRPIDGVDVLWYRNPAEI